MPGVLPEAKRNFELSSVRETTKVWPSLKVGVAVA
jgi:hypothetical protein